MKKILGLLCILSTVVLYNSNLSLKAETFVLEQVFNYMNTDILVTLYEGTQEDMDAIEDILKTYSHLADNYKGPDLDHEDTLYHQPNVVSINEARGQNAVVVDERLYDLLKQSITYYEQSNGYFNPAIGNAIDIWKSAIFSDYMYDEIPDSEFQRVTNELALISEDVDPNDIVFNDEEHSVFITNENLKIDLGAVAKGYANQRIYEYLQSKNITKFKINTGNSSLILGTHPDDSETFDRPFRVGLEDPLRKSDSGYFGILEVRNKAVVTSGNYLQYVTYKGKVYHHIISPFDFVPKQYYTVITIIGDDSSLLDAMSTAIFSMPLNEAKAMVDELGIEAIFYMNDGSIETANLTHNLIVDDKPKDSKGLYYILGGVVIVGGAIILGLSIYDKRKKGDDRADQV
ncbi:FAD:protein FMN transferase [Acholeplasma vituli]|uniref:FAD:protein FMN transferase n=1 Tax=Paracholeplasma vituli TaxID=69473 RepID=A0ABT2PWF3_9MOLU|nr:FAD:protein FMN transferase [Paracholeplasma vituli]MCU0104062.1 FAD:protein FMN transferase [Paracholeplasma vituli]